MKPHADIGAQRNLRKWAPPGSFMKKNTFNGLEFINYQGVFPEKNLL